ncbi:hypothetical protein LXL04_029321 [Taraxacum kok-saghyz]
MAIKSRFHGREVLDHITENNKIAVLFERTIFDGRLKFRSSREAHRNDTETDRSINHRKENKYKQTLKLQVTSTPPNPLGHLYKQIVLHNSAPQLIVKRLMWRLVRRMLLMENEKELEKESLRKRNPIPYAVWLAGKGIGINSRVFLLCKRQHPIMILFFVSMDVHSKINKNFKFKRTRIGNVYTIETKAQEHKGNKTWLLRKYPVSYYSSARTRLGHGHCCGSDTARTRALLRLGIGSHTVWTRGTEKIGRWCRDVREAFDRTPGVHGYCSRVSDVAEQGVRENWSRPDCCPGIAEQAFYRAPGVRWL